MKKNIDSIECWRFSILSFLLSILANSYFSKLGLIICGNIFLISFFISRKKEKSLLERLEETNKILFYMELIKQKLKRENDKYKTSSKIYSRKKKK